MKHFFPFAFLAFTLILFQACSDDDGPCIDPSGPIITEERNLSAFNAIDLRGIADVEITQGSPQKVEVRTHQNVLPLVETEVVNNTLIITMENESCFDNLDELDLYITMPDVTSLNLSGVGNISAENTWDITELDIELSGAGNIQLQGQVDTFAGRMSGVGNLDAFPFIINDCTLTVSGVGNAEITATSTLDVTISGVGNVSYKGNPTITSNITGVGELIDAN